MHAQTQTEETQNVIFNNSLIAIIHCVKNLILFLSVLEISLLCTAETLMQLLLMKLLLMKLKAAKYHVVPYYGILQNVTKCYEM